MPGQQDYNFQPVVRCPSCNGVNKPLISGWGREGLNTRFKTCKRCGLDYTLILYAKASLDPSIIEEIKVLEYEVKCLKERAYRRKDELLNERQEWKIELIKIQLILGKEK